MIRLSLSHMRYSVFVAVTFFATAFSPFSVHAAISPESQQQKDLQTMLQFIENHPLVLEGLVKIRLFDAKKAQTHKENPHVREVVYTIERKSKDADHEYSYNKQNNNNDTKTETVECVAKFTPTFSSLFLPAKSIRFSSSTCEID